MDDELINLIDPKTDETVQLHAPWRLHVDAASILMKLYPDVITAGDLSDVLPAQHPAVIAVRNAGATYLAAVQSMMELAALHAEGAIHPNYYAELGEAFERFVRREVTTGAKSVVIDLPQRKRAPFSLRRGIRGDTLLALLNKAIG